MVHTISYCSSAAKVQTLDIKVILNLRLYPHHAYRHSPPSSLNNRLVAVELERHGIDAMSLVSGRFVALAFEDMAQMAIAIGTNHLRACHAHCLVCVEFQSSWDSLVKSWPSTAALELGFGRVQRRITSRAVVCAFGKSVVVLAGIGSFCTLLSQHSKLFGRQHCLPFAFRLVGHFVSCCRFGIASNK